MKDMIGNRIDEGSLIFWKSNGIAYRVVKVVDSGLTVVGKGAAEQSPCFITLQVTLPVQLDPRQKGEPILPDFLCLIDPQSTQMVEGMLKQ